ncbi:cell wall-binding repeat-containing protein, partial [Microvirga sp. 3-52]|nr:cell wall-binding repeat-containing protein [Microvirga sp. 3-52]
MVEVEPGIYEGSWTVPGNINLQNVSVGITVTDLLGNQTTKDAKGKLMISQQKLARISGKDRYLTAIEISQQGWTKSDKVVLARGDGFADALAGVPLAHELNAPILLTVSS